MWEANVKKGHFCFCFQFYSGQNNNKYIGREKNKKKVLTEMKWSSAYVMY